MKSKYQKPKISVTKVKMNMFWQNRSIDALETLHLNQKSLFAASICGSFYVSSSTSCFPQHSRVALADGTIKPIEEITTQDIVLSFDEKTMALTESKVKELIIHENSDSEYLIINEKLRVTKEHVMYINGNWVSSETIKVNDRIINNTGESETVFDVRQGEKKVQNMYNLELEGKEHNFFVEGILVHNSKKTPSPS